MKKELKQQIVSQVAEDKKARKEWKARLSAMSPDEKKAEKEKVRAERKAEKTARKQEIKSMDKPERRAAKKHDKVYRKVWHRPRRAIVWTAVLCVVVYVLTLVVPIVSSMAPLFSISIDSDSPAGVEARANGEQIAGEISDEGIVLLKNEGGALPLSESKINVFSIAAGSIRYGGGGSGGADSSRSVTLYDGLTNAGIEYNQELYNKYDSMGAVSKKSSAPGLFQVAKSMLGGGTKDEPDIAYLTDEIVSQAKSYSQNALIVIGSDGVESSDLSKEQLKLTENKRALIEKVASNFENVIIVINAGNTIELGFLDEYPSIKAALWIGTPGPKGCDSLGKILAGTVNPSGRLTDTYAYDGSSNPASVNFGDYKYTNIPGKAFINYNEGIYIGYRYYETFFEGDEAGYNAAVQFPFGYGLSYTDFEWEITDSSLDEETVSLDVKVTNTGDVAGKDVVQVYFSAPYTAGGIEKSAIELGGYAKTGLLAPGADETVTIEFATRDMSSYDMSYKQAYVLEKGTYQIRLGKNVHDIVESLPYEVEETVVYDTDEVTGTALSNQFDYADGDLTYLSRNDVDGTYPDNTDLSYTASDELVKAYNDFIKPAKVETAAPTTGADNGIKLSDLKDLAYDDPRWSDFLDQFTVEEMKQLVLEGAYHTVAIDRLGVPSSVLLDGPAGINSFFSKVTAASYPTEVVLASTWNDELAYRMGEAVGMEANAYGVNGWYAPGMNIHRTPQGGRNFEYFSEDPQLSGKISAAIISGAQSRDIIVTMKHFVLNDQETNARSGIFVWANEQAIREIYLRPFEITVKEGGVTGAMSSFVHIGYKWCGGNEELLKNVLRDEWGFVGLVTTDAVLGKFMDINLGIRNGNDLSLDPMPSGNMKYFNKLYKADPAGITEGLRYCTHNICYSLVNYTTLFN